MSAQVKKPLAVDMDGTLLLQDSLHEMVLRALWQSPIRLLKLCLSCGGKAVFKYRLSRLIRFEPETAPLNSAFLQFLNGEKAQGRKLILSTGSDSEVALGVSQFVGIFDEVIASDGLINLVGKNKAEALVHRFGVRGFDYAGNSVADFAVWSYCDKALVVNAPPSVERKAVQKFRVSRVFSLACAESPPWMGMLRCHQWLKNLLLFLPLLAAHEIGNLDAWQSLVLAFFSFSLCASAVYIANDLRDLDSDRRHPRKRKRPFASGAVPIWKGVALAPVLLAVSFALAFQVGTMFMGWLLAYFVVTCLYSLSLKRLILVDCLTLAMLYTFRILAGAATVGHVLSFWLLAFSVFLFLSLAFVKRYAELEVLRLNEGDKAHGRGYHTDDASLLQNIGISSGQASVLVLALYLNSDAVTELYSSPELIWCAVPVMLFWIQWMWMQAHRGKMHDDPLVFALKDPVSVLSASLVGAILVTGAMGVLA